MDRFLGMSVMRGLVFGSALLVVACGGEQSVASKSAAAYDEAKAKGVAVGGGHDHGDHEAAASETGHAADATATDAHAGHDMTGDSTAMDHSAHGAAGATDHAATGHGTAANAHAGHGMSSREPTDHSAHRSGGSAVDHAAMGHGTSASNAHAQHGTASAARGAHAGHGTTRQTASHDQHAGMQHAAPSRGADPHAQHRQAAPGAQPMDHARHGTTAAPPGAAADPHAHHRMGGTTATPIAANAPRSNRAMRSVQPAATLQPDVFDAPAPIAVAEAIKAVHGGGDGGPETRSIVPGTDHENPPTPMPAIRDRANTAPVGVHRDHGAATATGGEEEAAAVYTCPMHPEITSEKPGTCPKCGMALVKKNG